MSDWLPNGKLPDASTPDGAFLFLVGVILNQSISGELAWRGVARLATRTDLRPHSLLACSAGELETVMRRRPAVHPFAAAMARAVIDAAEVVCHSYHGDTRLLWREAADPGEVMRRLTGLRQIGRHKAEVGMYLLTSVYKEMSAPSTTKIRQTCPALLSYLEQGLGDEQC